MNQNQAPLSSPKYKGVRKRKWGKYVSEIRLPNSRERIWLGSYDTAVKAARAFDAAQFCLRGNSGSFNFDPPDIPGGSSMTPQEIQAAAARFANSEEESSQPSVVLQTDSFEMTDLPLENMFMINNEAGRMEENYDYYPHHEFGMFSGYGEFAGDFIVPEPPPPYVEYWPESNEETVFSGASSFLWNF